MRIRIFHALTIALSLGIASHAFAANSSEEIYNAIVIGDVDFIEAQKDIPRIINYKDQPLNLLILSSQWRQAKIVDFLLKNVEENSDFLERVDANGRTALYYAAFYGREDIALSLLRKGAKTSSIDNSLLIELLNNTEIRDLLADRGDTDTAPSFIRSIPRYKFKINSINVHK